MTCDVVTRVPDRECTAWCSFPGPQHPARQIPAPRQDVLALRDIGGHLDLVNHLVVDLRARHLAARHVRRGAQDVVDSRRELHARGADRRGLARAEVGLAVRRHHAAATLGASLGVDLLEGRDSIPAEASVAQVAIAHGHRVFAPHRALRVGADAGRDGRDHDRRLGRVRVPDLGLVANKVERCVLEALLGRCRAVRAQLANAVRVTTGL
eukprot:7376556-Prymnesium_polylepis.2